MQTALRSVGWGLQRLAMGLGILFLGAFFIYATWVFLIVAAQAVSGQ